MTEYQNKTLPQKLKELRLFSGLSQRKIAKAFYISRACWSNYERGLRQPTVEFLKKIADFFGVDVDYLLSDENAGSDMEDFILRRTALDNNLSKDGQLSLADLSMTNKISLVDYYMFLKKNEKKKTSNT